MGSADAVLRDYQDIVINRTPLPLLFKISGRAKQSIEPKKAQKRAVRGVAGQQHSNHCTLRLSILLISDLHTYLVVPHIISAVPPSVDSPAQDPQYVNNGTAQELITSHMLTISGDNLQISNSVLCPLLLLSLFRPQATAINSPPAQELQLGSFRFPI